MTGNMFAFDWDAPMTAEEEDRVIDAIARRIAKHGLETPAIWMIEIHRPLFSLLGQGAIVFSPGLAPFFARGAYDLQKVSKVMRSPGCVDKLVRQIELRAEEVRLGSRL